MKKKRVELSKPMLNIAILTKTLATKTTGAILCSPHAGLSTVGPLATVNASKIGQFLRTFLSASSS